MNGGAVGQFFVFLEAARQIITSLKCNNHGMVVFTSAEDVPDLYVSVLCEQFSLFDEWTSTDFFMNEWNF